MRYYIEIAATVLTILGFFLVSTGQLTTVGFTISACANVLWIIWGKQAGSAGIITVNACLLLASINGIINSV